ncbi:MAG: Sensory transduction protein lytT [Spirosoma sp.]|nr:Sensory transduction protein lytT [Spirosoma sp.]
MNKLISCLVIDDEPHAQELLVDYIAALPSLCLKGQAYNAVEGLTLLEQNKPDVLLLDINMPRMSGLDMLRSLTGRRPHIILTTAYPEYAVEGFELDVVDYLTKPIRFERFVRAINKVKERIGSNPEKQHTLEPTEPIRQVEPNSTVMVREGKSLINIAYQDILLIEAMDDYIKIFLTGSARPIVAYQRMSRMEEVLPFPPFIRVNRSYIVRKDSIKRIDGNVLHLSNGREVTISRKYWDSLMQHMKVA